MNIDEIFYFGCYGEAGHYLFNRQMYCVHDGYDGFPKDFPVMEHVLDSGLLGYSNPSQVQGQAILSHIGKWTIISFWDRTGDSRRQSNSNFIMRGIFPFDEAIRLAKENFPGVFARINFEIRQA